MTCARRRPERLKTGRCARPGRPERNTSVERRRRFRAAPASPAGSSRTRPPANAAPPLKPTSTTGRPAGRDVVEPAAEPVHGAPRASRRRGRPMPRLANQANPPPSRDRRPHRGVRRSGGQVRRQAEDLALVGAAAVQQDDQGRGGVGGAVRRDDRRREGRGHDASTGTSSAAVRTPAHGRPRRAGRAARRVRRSRSRPTGLGQHPHHLELVAVGVVGVDALGRAVAGLAGEGVEVRQREPGLLELLDGVDLPRQVVEPEGAARAGRLGADPEQAEVVVVARTGAGAGRRRSRAARAPRPPCRRPAGRTRRCARGRPRTARRG